jgi:phage shock protein PspC (stress-responsive transcriptional regulator)
MEQTVSMNLSGLVFHIEKPAYENLRQYLKDIRSQLDYSDNAEDTMQDVESRIAELFEEYLGSRKEVITHKDVERVKAEMGAPSTFNEEQEQDSTSYTSQSESPKSFPVSRDTENNILGGVCAGIGQAYDFNPVWLRLAFVAAVLIFGSGVLVYLALWLVLPAKKKSDEPLRDQSSRARAKKLNFQAKLKAFLVKTIQGLETAFAELWKACRRASSRLQQNA